MNIILENMKGQYIDIMESEKLKVHTIEDLKKLPIEERNRIINLMSIIHVDYIRRKNQQNKDEKVEEKNSTLKFKNKLKEILEEKDGKHYFNYIMVGNTPVGYGIAEVKGKYGIISETHSARAEMYERIPNSELIFGPELTKRGARRESLLMDAEKWLNSKGATVYIANITGGPRDIRFYERKGGYCITTTTIGVPVEGTKENSSRVEYVNAVKGPIKIEEVLFPGEEETDQMKNERTDKTAKEKNNDDREF